VQIENSEAGVEITPASRFLGNGDGSAGHSGVEPQCDASACARSRTSEVWHPTSEPAFVRTGWLV